VTNGVRVFVGEFVGMGVPGVMVAVDVDVRVIVGIGVERNEGLVFPGWGVASSSPRMIRPRTVAVGSPLGTPGPGPRSQAASNTRGRQTKVPSIQYQAPNTRYRHARRSALGAPRAFHSFICRI